MIYRKKIVKKFGHIVFFLYLYTKLRNKRLTSKKQEFMKTIFEKEGLQIVLEESPVHEGQFYVTTKIGEKTVSYECYMNELDATRKFYIEIVNCTGYSKYIYNK